MIKTLLKLENLTFIGALLGLGLGHFFPGATANISVLGELFILLLKMVIVPLVFVSVFLAIARQESLESIGKLGGRTILYFITTSALACLTGLLAAAFLPEVHRTGINYANYDAGKLGAVSFKEIILGFFSPNPFKTFAQGNIIQIVVMALLAGAASLKLERSRRASLMSGTEGVHDIVMIIIGWVLILAPVGVFSLVATVVATTDKSAFSGLGWLFAAIAAAEVVHCLVTLPVLGFVFGKFNPYHFLLNVREVMLVALATASSNATLPVSTRVLVEDEKVDPKTAGFVLPLGATINMDGSSIYQTLIVLFLASLAGIDVTVSQQVYIFFLILISSVGTAGIPGGGILMMGAVLQNVGVPLEYLGIYLLVDRFWDPPVTMINVLGDLFGAKIIDRYS